MKFFMAEVVDPFMYFFFFPNRFCDHVFVGWVAAGGFGFGSAGGFFGARGNVQACVCSPLGCGAFLDSEGARK